MRKEANVAFFVEASSIEDKFSRDRTEMVVRGGDSKTKTKERTETHNINELITKLTANLNSNSKQLTYTATRSEDKHIPSVIIRR